MPRKHTCVMNYALCPLLFRASTTFSGLIGNSLIRTPMASLTAFAIVANVGVMGGSPTAFGTIGTVRGRHLNDDRLYRWKVCRSWNAVIDETGIDVPFFAVLHLFHHRPCVALHCSTLDLPFNRHRIDGEADILRSNEFEDSGSTSVPDQLRPWQSVPRVPVYWIAVRRNLFRQWDHRVWTGYMPRVRPMKWTSRGQLR